MKFVIFAEGDYSPNGGGSVALHKLCHNIALLGEDAYIMTSKKNPNYLGQQVNLRQAIELCKEDAIAIYPEVTCDNPFNCKNVMRWILYHVRTYGNHGAFLDTDLLYAYAPFFKLRFPRPFDGELRAHELNLDIFTDKNQPRKGDCYLIKKGNDKEHNQHSETAICLDGYPKYGERANEYLAKVFNECERFISYDTATYLNVMAALCGCESVVIPDPNTTPEQWHNGYPYFKYGIAYGLDDLDYAKSTQHLVKQELLSIEAETLEQTKEFIKKAYTL